MKNLLILSGGGFKASYQVGVINYLIDNDISIDAVMGTSGGALNALMVAQGKFKELNSIWNDIAYNGTNLVFESDLIDLNTMKFKLDKLYSLLIKPVLRFDLVTKKGRTRAKDLIKLKLQSIDYLATNNGLRNLIRSNFIYFSSIKIPYYFNFVSLMYGKEIVSSKTDYTTEEDMIEGILASTSIPVLIEPKRVKVKNDIYEKCVDGGISSNILLNYGIDFVNKQQSKDWRIIIVNCNNKELDKLNYLSGVGSLFSRTVLEVMLNSLTLKDFKAFNTINYLADNNKYKEIPFVYIEPKNYSLGDTLFIDENINNYRITKGYQDAKNEFLI